MKREKIIGIYCIENLVNGKKYIGKSLDIYDRWRKHVNDLKNGTHDNSYLCNSWKKYGSENFSFTIIEICKREELEQKEISYISKFETTKPNGYNLTRGGDGTLGYRHTEESKNKMSEKKKGIPSSQKGKTSILKGSKVSPEALLNMKKSMTEERKLKLSKMLSGENSPAYGIPRTNDVKNKISEKLKEIYKNLSGDEVKKLSDIHYGIQPNRKKENNSSFYRGVHYDKSNEKWVSSITYYGEYIFLKRHKTEEEAARAYDKKCYELYGENAKLNFPEEYGLNEFKS